MENASKALIIAGAILLSILIIGLGMLMFNQAKDAITGTGIDDQKVKAYNAQYDDYMGTNVNGTKVTKNMEIIPLDHNLLYVELIYTQYINEEDALPTLKKVVVASGTKVAIGDNLKQALNNLISQYAVNIEIENTDTMEDLVNTIIKANNNLTNSNTSNDWEMMGKDVKKLQELIRKLETLVEEENKLKNEINEENKKITTNNVITANEIQ